MKFLDVLAVILAIVSVLLISSGVASVGLTIGLENAGQALPAAAEPVVSGSGPASTWNVPDAFLGVPWGASIEDAISERRSADAIE